MTDTQLSINPDEITGVLRRHLEGFRPDVEKQQVGRIIEVGDGIARISGLPSTAVNELLEFEGGVLGLALNLDEDSIGAVVLGDIEHIEEGQSAKATGHLDDHAWPDGAAENGRSWVELEITDPPLTVMVGPATA